MRINIDNISPNKTKSLPPKNPDLRRAGNNVDNAVQRKALRDTVASYAINNGNNNTDNNNLSRVPAETKGHMVSFLSTLYGQDLVWLSLLLYKILIDFYPGDSSELTKFWVQQLGHRGQPGGRGEARGGGEVAY